MRALWVLVVVAACGGGGGDPAQRCVRLPDGACVCDAFDHGSAPAVASCEPAAVGAGAYCCSFPADSACACASPICFESDTVAGYCGCQLGLLSFKPDPTTDVCTPSGGVGKCCKFSDASGSTCDCFSGSNVHCLADETEVATCRPDDIVGCGSGLPVATCAGTP